jgi:hypothetical protein
MENRPAFDTVTASLEWLKGQGYTQDFNTWLTNGDQGHSLSPEDFQIDYVFRFEGDSDPDDEDIVYGLSSERLQTKGVLTTAFGPYADDTAIAVVARLAIRK